MPEFHEFFCGGGMARAGLGPGWSCRYANDISPLKARVYRDNWGDDIDRRDIGLVRTADIPGTADLAWASFPCQDLSSAGRSAGLGAANDASPTRSGAFWAYMNLVERLADEGRQPRCIVLENVYGLLHSNGCRDFAAVVEALSRAGYVSGALLVDAAWFLPQSRVRVFVVAVRCDMDIPAWLHSPLPLAGWHPAMMRRAASLLEGGPASDWTWWDPGERPMRTATLHDVIDGDDPGAGWHDRDRVGAVLSMMSPPNAAKVEDARRSGWREFGGLYMRRRPEGGTNVLRAEVRFDDTLGCVRTGKGGSSRQGLVVVKGADTSCRLVTPRESARLMGLPDAYRLPDNAYEALDIIGDGVALPVVRFLAERVVEPIIGMSGIPLAVAAE